MFTISFIIPTYNAERYLERCLKSIIDQNYPQKKIEIIVIDGGSTDKTLDIAKRYKCQILRNPKKLAEYGVQIGVLNAKGDFLVIFAADNELIGNDWIEKVMDIFEKDINISAVWGRLSASDDDSSLNKYYALIQNDPLNWFINKNLNKYIKNALIYNKNCYVFNVYPDRPLVWGANGLVYRKERIKHIWQRDSYLGDNDAFQYMIEEGNNKVAYFDEPFVYHHHVKSLADWTRKWKRNFTFHFLDKLETRNINWIFVNNLKVKLILWIIYSLVPLFSFLDSMKNAIMNKNIYWLYHTFVAFLQTASYIVMILFTRKWRLILKFIIYRNND